MAKKWVATTLWISWISIICLNNNWCYSKLNFAWKPLQQYSFVQCITIYVVKRQLRPTAGTNPFSLAPSNRTWGKGMNRSQGSCINASAVENKCTAMAFQIPAAVVQLYASIWRKNNIWITRLGIWGRESPDFFNCSSYNWS